MGHENGGWMNADQMDAMKDEAHRVASVASEPAPGPQTLEEARQFHEGFLAGATAYCAAVGHSCLKSENEKLREVFDAQGWKTIETFEKMPKPDWRIGLNCKPKLRTHPLFNCAHNCVIIGTRPSSIHRDGLILIAVDDGRQLLEPADDWVTATKQEPEQLEGFDCRAGFCPSQPLSCANCGKIPTNPGQFVRDNRWVCSDQCRKELCDKQSYDDLAASGGIVDAP